MTVDLKERLVALGVSTCCYAKVTKDMQCARCEKHCGVLLSQFRHKKIKDLKPTVVQKCDHSRGHLMACADCGADFS